MLDTTELTKTSVYRIAGKFGDWRYSHKIPGARPRYIFWRFHTKSQNTKVRLELSQNQVLEKVSEYP